MVFLFWVIRSEEEADLVDSLVVGMLQYVWTSVCVSLSVCCLLLTHVSLLSGISKRRMPCVGKGQEGAGGG